MSYFVVCVYADGSAFTINLEPVTMARAERSIDWQRIGQGAFDDWRIASIKDGHMVDQSGNRLRLKRSPYTVEAWEAFLSREGLIDPDSIVSRIRADRQGGAGDLLTMGDGSVWFHPYSGASPVKER